MKTSVDSADRLSPWRRAAALLLVVAALGLPINDLLRYALLVAAAVPIFAGEVSRRTGAWLAALTIVVAVCVAQLLWPTPKIEEGHNIFLAEDSGGVLEKGLPPGAFRIMAQEFDASFPPGRRCNPRENGCWRGSHPEKTYAFSADGILDAPMYSRRVAGIGFSDPSRLRLGFINERQYNWYSGQSEIQRYSRTRGLGHVLQPWQFTIPYFVMYRLPESFAGGRLCWQGLVLWEGDGGAYDALRRPAGECRTLGPGDAGRMIFGVAIGAPLAMTLESTWPVTLRRMLAPSLAFAGVLAVLLLLVRVRPRQLALPALLIGLALVIVLLHDSAFIGGVRPFDGGDDGLIYEGMAREMIQQALADHVSLALQGTEKVFYYGGPGLRYLRAFEHVVFGESFLGYLSLMLLLPFVVFAAFRRFLSARAALAMALIFVALPIGALFGSTYFQYVKWASRGFADPAAATLFLAGFVMLAGRTGSGPGLRFSPAFGAGLLFALALWLRPNLSPGAAVLLGGAGLAALWHGEIRRLAGLCIGFLPVFGMALHNWVFGGVFVLFSANATITEALPMPPAAYVAAAGELLRFDWGGENVRKGLLQWARWLAGPSESFAMIPIHALAIAVLVRVAAARGFDGWLRLGAGAALALHTVALFYLSYDRYYYLNWLLTLLVCAVWLRDEGAILFARKCPRMAEWMMRHPARARFNATLDSLAGSTGVRG